AVDRGERRPQLVRDGGDEVGLHLVERALCGEVAEGVDDAVGRLDAGDGEPELAAADVERQALRQVRRGPGRLGDADTRREVGPAGDRLGRVAAEDVVRPQA